MKKIYLSLGIASVLALSNNYSSAQSFSFSPSKTLYATAEYGYNNVFDIDIKNEKNDTLMLSWRLLSNQLNTKWDYSICDNQNCFFFIPTGTTIMKPTLKGGKAFFKLNLNLQDIDGSGSVSFIVKDKDNPTDFDTVTFVVNSKSYFVPTKKTEEMLTNNQNNEFRVDIFNKKSSPLKLNWFVVENTLDTKWEQSICDNDTCYADAGKSIKTMNPIVAGDSGFITLNINPKDSAGGGMVKIYVYDEDENKYADTLIFDMNAFNTSISEFTIHNSQFTIYPNPAKDFITISIKDNGAKNVLEVYNIIGVKMMELPVITDGSMNKINVNILENGIYFIKYQDKNSNISTRKFCKIE